MKLAMIGSGRVGNALGERFARAGHEIVYGVRNTRSDRAIEAQKSTPGSRLASLKDAAAEADVIVFCPNWDGAEEAAKALGDLHGKVLVDVTNPFGGTPLSTAGSGAQAVQAWVTNGRVVKSFNNIGSANFPNLDFGAQRPATFICGDDAGAKKVAADLGEQIGFEPIDLGPLENAGMAESAARLWITLAYRQGLGPDIALAVIRR
jgi:predicted dinucleotide-binding enzyme